MLLKGGSACGGDLAIEPRAKSAIAILDGQQASALQCSGGVGVTDALAGCVAITCLAQVQQQFVLRLRQSLNQFGLLPGLGGEGVFDHPGVARLRAQERDPRGLAIWI